MNPNEPNLYLWLIPLLPLAGAAINGLFGRYFSKRLVATVGLIFVAAAFVLSAWASWQLTHLAMKIPHTESLGTWIAAGTDFHVDFSFYLDQLSMVMILVVTGVGFLIHVYSVGYMEHEGGYYRFFAYLIGFFFTKDSAANAGKKAFIVNRIGDFGFLIAMFLLFQKFHSLDFSDVFNGASSLPVESFGSIGILTAIALLLMLGAAGKSAQIPLYVWLPDAMEGPTP